MLLWLLLLSTTDRTENTCTLTRLIVNAKKPTITGIIPHICLWHYANARDVCVRVAIAVQSENCLNGNGKCKHKLSVNISSKHCTFNCARELCSTNARPSVLRVRDVRMKHATGRRSRHDLIFAAPTHINKHARLTIFIDIFDTSLLVGKKKTNRRIGQNEFSLHARRSKSCSRGAHIK